MLLCFSSREADDMLAGLAFGPNTLRDSCEEEVSLWQVTTDDGPDISACRKMMQNETADKEQTIMLELECFHISMAS